jgi:hypothetical protein
VTKTTNSIALPTNSPDVGEKICTIAGLPLSTALICASLFTIAFWSYTILWKDAPAIVPDSYTYLKAAQDLSDFHMDQLQPRPPGYPILLLFTQSTLFPNRTLFFVSLLLHFASIWLLATVLYRAGVRALMLAVFAFILLLPPYVESAAYVLSENLSEIMIVVGFVSFISWIPHKRVIWVIVSALAFGYAALTRPTYQIVTLAIAGYLLLARFVLPWAAVTWRDAVKSSLVLICGSILLVGGYSFLNYHSFGYFGVTPNLGLNLSTKTARFVERLPDEYAATREKLVRARDAALLTDPAHTGQMYIWGLSSDVTKGNLSEQAQLSGYMLKLNLLLIKNAPLSYLQEVFWAFGSYWLPSSDQFANLNSRFLQLLWAVIHFCLINAFAVNLILVLGAVTYLKMCNFVVRDLDNMTNRKAGFIQFEEFVYGLAGTIVIYNAGVSCLIEIGNPRHRAPTDALIIFMLFLGTHLWWRLIDLSKAVLKRTTNG